MKEREGLEEILLDLEGDSGPSALFQDQEKAWELLGQVRDWQRRMEDLGEHSCSEASRQMARELRQEDEAIWQCLLQVQREDEKDPEHSLGALSLEYLQDRARQALREVLLEALCLRIAAAREKERGDRP